MKYIIILLLSVSGVEEIKLPTYHLDCGEIATAWMDVNTTYRGVKSDQGNYTYDGKLLMGYICTQ